jgi:hypothetical protein
MSKLEWKEIWSPFGLVSVFSRLAIAVYIMQAPIAI